MTVHDRIVNILRVSHSARNSDLELWLIYAKKSGLNLTREQIEVLKDMPSFETIRRTRQKIQERGNYLADKEVDEARYNKFKEVRGSIGIVDEPERLLEVSGYRNKEWGNTKMKPSTKSKLDELKDYTVEEMINLIASHISSIELPEKKKDTRGATQNPSNPKYLTKYATAYNDCLKDCQAKLDEAVKALKENK